MDKDVKDILIELTQSYEYGAQVGSYSVNDAERDICKIITSLKEKIEAIEWSEVEKTIPDYNPDFDRGCGSDFMKRYVLSLISKYMEETK